MPARAFGVYTSERRGAHIACRKRHVFGNHLLAKGKARQGKARQDRRLSGKARQRARQSKAKGGRQIAEGKAKGKAKG